MKPTIWTLVVLLITTLGTVPLFAATSPGKGELSIRSTLSAVDTHSGGHGRRRSMDRPEEVEGIVVAISGEWLTVRTGRLTDRVIRLDASTQIYADGRRVTSDSILIGDEVELLVRRSNDGTFVAVTVEVEFDDETEGVVQSFDGTVLVIRSSHGEVTFLVTPGTIIVLDDARVFFSAIRPGMRVEVEWRRGLAGIREAVVIEIEARCQVLQGTAVSVSPDVIVVRTRSGRELTIRLTSGTLIRRDDVAFPITALLPGMHLKVKVLSNDDGTYTALIVDIEEEGELAELEGVIVEVGSDRVVIRTEDGDEVVVFVLPGTIIRRDDEHGLLSLADLRPGDHVEIKVQRDATGRYIAVRIELEDDDDGESEIEGVITAITGSMVTIRTEGGREVTVLVTSSTKISRDDHRIGVSELRVGDRVEVVARRNADGSLEALEIEIEDEDGDEEDHHGDIVELEGVVRAVSAGELVVLTRRGTVTIKLDAATIVKWDDRRADLTFLRPGQRVEVKARRLEDGTYLALVIEIEDED